MAEIQKIIPVFVLISHLALLALFISLIAKNRLAALVGKHALILGLLISLAALVGSLFYSEIAGFPPCVLCWWQRVGLYPLLILFAVAALKRDRGVFSYAVPLAAVAGLIALYHSYVYMGGTSILPCTALGGACSKVYVFAFGYITIPLMSLTIALYILLLAWSNKIYANSNS